VPRNVFNGNLGISDGEIPSVDEWNRLGIFGDGSDGSYTSGDNLTPGQVYNFTDFVLNSGDTLSSTASNSGEPIIIKVQGNVEINGTINLKGQGFGPRDGFTNTQIRDGQEETFANPAFYIGYGTPGADGHVHDNASNEFEIGRAVGGIKYPKSEFMNAALGNPMPASGTGGGNGQAKENVDTKYGGGAGGASYDANGNDGGQNTIFSGGNTTATSGGGSGGGSIVIFCSGDFSFNGTIDIRGNDGNDSNGAAGGGGGAGMCYVIYKGVLTDTGAKQVAGGSGGTGNANGGTGANGTILFESVS